MTASRIRAAGWVTTVVALVLSVTAPMASAQAPAATGLVPVFDKPVSTAHGFTVNVLNYTHVYAWSVKTDAGKVRTGVPSGLTWPITVTGLRPGQSATVEVRADMPGLDSNPVTVRGTALKGTGTEPSGSKVTITVDPPAPRLAAMGARPWLVAIKLTGGYSTRRVPVSRKGGRVSVRVTPGVWAFVSSSPGYEKRTTVALVAADGSVRVRAGGPRPPAGVPRVSFGNVTSKSPLINTSDMSRFVESTVFESFASAPCDIINVVDRESREYQSILDEVTLRSTDMVTPEDRLVMSEAMQTLQAWAPTHRLTGSVDGGWDRWESGPASGQFTITSGGKVVVSKRISVDHGGQVALQQAAAQMLVSEVCPGPQLQVAVTGHLTASDHDLHVDAQGDVSLFYFAKPQSGSPSDYSPVVPVSWQLSEKSATGTGHCTAEAVGGDAGPPIAAPSVTAFRGTDGSYSVWIYPRVFVMAQLSGDSGGCDGPPMPVYLSGALNGAGEQYVKLPPSGTKTFTEKGQIGKSTFTATMTVTVTEKKP